ncbi:MAG: ribonuclease HII [Armatimonadetes bacterium]|nr:ribonuclease HII [Armatimonadota bacterium]
MPTPPTDIFEQQLRQQHNCTAVAGVDEAGRGALAGPVVAAAVVLPAGCLPDGVRDSKLIPEQERERLYDVVMQHAVAWAVGIVGQHEIDRINILRATVAAMRQAVRALATPPHALLVDGRDTIDAGIPCRAVVGGDRLSVSIAAASIVAKVTRDRVMRAAHQQHPQFGFDRHKGYGTAQHRQAIQQHGPTNLHRLTFLGKVMQEKLEFE